MALAFIPMMKKRWVTKLKSTSTIRCHCEFNRKIHEEDQAHRAGFLTPLDPRLICSAFVNSCEGQEGLDTPLKQSYMKNIFKLIFTSTFLFFQLAQGESLSIAEQGYFLLAANTPKMPKDSAFELNKCLFNIKNLPFKNILFRL